MGERKISQRTPPPKRVFPPLSGVFSTPPFACRCSVFPVQYSTTEQRRSSSGYVQKSWAGVLWYVVLPHTFSTVSLESKMGEIT